MIKRSISILSRFAYPNKYAASYYKTVCFFQYLKEFSKKKQKEMIISGFLDTLVLDERRDFQALMKLIQVKGNIGITMSSINKYYIENNVPKEGHQAYKQLLSQGGLSNVLCKEQIKESEITLYDINILFKHIFTLQGTGSATYKINLIINLISNLSKIQGLYLLKIIDKKLTIGVSAKTFNKMLR